jgi:hypothetical protein
MTSAGIAASCGLALTIADGTRASSWQSAGSAAETVAAGAADAS